MLPILALAIDRTVPYAPAGAAELEESSVVFRDVSTPETLFTSRIHGCYSLAGR
jgi:hypothetical protein